LAPSDNVIIMSNLSDLPAQTMAEASNWSDLPANGEFLIHGVNGPGQAIFVRATGRSAFAVYVVFSPGGAALGRDALIGYSPFCSTSQRWRREMRARGSGTARAGGDGARLRCSISARDNGLRVTAAASA